MNKLEIIDRIEEIQTELREKVSTIEVEQRKLNETESVKFENLILELNEMRGRLSDLKTNSKKEVKMKRKEVTLLNILAEKRAGKLSKETEEILKEGRSQASKSGVDFKSDIVVPMSMEERAVNVGTDSEGGFIVATEKLDILSPLVNELVLTKAGARVMTGLVGDVSVPSIDGITATWESETATTANQDPTFGAVNFAPKRLSVVVPVSNTWFEQDSVGASNALNQLIIDKIRIKLEETALGAAAETVGKIPAGLLNGAVAGGAMTLKGVVDMEGECLEANVNPGCYIVHPKLMVKAKSTPVDAGSGKMLLEDGYMNGYPVFYTNSVAKGMATAKDEYGILLGDFSQFYICYWNNLGITIDPYTLASSNQTRLIVNFYVDFKAVRSSAIVAKSMK